MTIDSCSLGCYSYETQHVAWLASYLIDKSCVLVWHMEQYGQRTDLMLPCNLGVDCDLGLP